MKRKICINPKMDIAENQLLYWSDLSGKDSEIIHYGRNQIKLILTSPTRITIKRFSQTLKNRIIYSVFQSKARKSYQNALMLLKRSVPTPMPYGYIEQRNNIGILESSEYICAYEESLTLYEAILKYSRKCLGAFAAFVACLHENGIRHDDLNNSNVRVMIDEENNFKFSLIDLNRMKIYKEGQVVPERQCFKNICRFSSLDRDYIYFVMKYLESRNLAKEKMHDALSYKKSHDKKINAKKWFKKLIKMDYI